MKLLEIYRLAVDMGISADPRGEEAVRKELAKEKRRYDEKLSGEEKELYDAERLLNPYADSRILFGDPEKEVKKIMAGVDTDTAELLLADRLNERGAGIDLVLGHHPSGPALASLGDVMKMQSGHLALSGVLPNVAEAIMSGRISDVERSVSGSNHCRALDAARLLGLPFMCVHTPTDNLAADFLQKLIAAKDPQTVGDLCDFLKAIPEYKQAGQNNNPARILSGKESTSLGKVYVDFTGGTSGPEEAYERLADAGVSTVVVMHIGEKHLSLAKKHHLSIVLAGHIASDSLGINLFLDALVERGVEILPVSGLLRVRR
ncbi:MAG: NGG1p interacting factor NIF3 [Clostridiales bacterium]|nr:NGG1p interacting factor NIF3 [Clostridiales bacterium]